MDTLIGPLTIECSETSLKSIGFGKSESELIPNDITKLTVQELNEYFSGTRKVFNVPLEPDGTDFRKKVWLALSDIPYGKTISYKELAIRLGDLKAIRAVGTANGANPIPVIIPCHRVIGSNGDLTGYAGGLPIKKKLLDLENPSPQISIFE